MIQLTVYGMPGPQGSKKFVGTHNGRGILIESSKKVKPWRQAVIAAVVENRERLGTQMVTGPLDVTMSFTLPKPKSAPKRRVIYPDRKPDLSKLIRSTEDALSDAAAWEDDARVVKLTAFKRYPGEGLLALDSPGVIIYISEFRETQRPDLDV